VNHMVMDHKKDIKEFEKEAKKSDAVGGFANETLPTLRKHLDKGMQPRGCLISRLERSRPLARYSAQRVNGTGMNAGSSSERPSGYAPGWPFRFGVSLKTPDRKRRCSVPEHRWERAGAKPISAYPSSILGRKFLRGDGGHSSMLQGQGRGS